MRKFLIILCFLIFPLTALAQSVAEIAASAEDDKGFLTNLLEKNLSGAGREIIITGFEGALSSRATFDSITIADDDGVWLTLKDGAIQWNRTALLRGRIEIAELYAKEITLPRLPGGGESADAPKAEAREFALPELPVSVNIEKIQADRVELGEPVIGIPAAISVNGSMSLAGGEGKADLSVKRLDGPRGEFVLHAGYANETKVLNFNLSLDEAKDGLLANLINLYEKPSVTAQISGQGPLENFRSDLRLATDGKPRVTGFALVESQTARDGTPGHAFRLELDGDVASLLPPDDRAFFGANSELKAVGWRAETGRMNIPQLEVKTEAMSLEGFLRVNDKGAPERAKLEMLLGSDAGAPDLPVSLPGGGQNTTVESGRLELLFDASQGRGWTLNGYVGELDQGTASVGEMRLDGSGEVITDDTGALSEITGELNYDAKDISFDDPGLAEAVGSAINGKARFNYGSNQLEINELTIEGSDYGLEGYTLLSGLSSGLNLSMDMDASYDDLSRLSTLAGRPVSGSGEITLEGYYAVLSKAFDIEAQVIGNDITIDQEQVDRLLSGESRIVLDARRDETGTELEEFSVKAHGLTANAYGYLNRETADVSAKISMPELGVAGGDYGGSVEVTAQLTGAQGARQLEVNGDVQNLTTGIDALDGALQGDTDLSILAGQSEDGFQLKTFDITNPQLRAEGKGNFAKGALDAVASFTVPDLSKIQSTMTGSLNMDAKLSEKDGTRFIDLTGLGENLRFGDKGDISETTGKTVLNIQAEEKAGVVTLRDVKLNNNQMNVTAQGVYGEGVTDLTADLDISTLAPLGLGWKGGLNADASMQEAGKEGRRFEVTGTGTDLAFGLAQADSALAGEIRLSVSGTEKDGVVTLEQAQIENPRLNATASGLVGGGKTDLTANVNASDLGFIGNGFSGSVSADAHLTEENGTRSITATGTANGLAIGQEKVDPILRGQTSFDIAASQSETGISVQKLLVNNPQLNIEADGNMAEAMNVEARLNDLAQIVPGFAGALTVNGTVQETPDSFVVDLGVTAPGDTDLQIAGSAARDFSTSDISVTGSSNASVANSFIRTRSIQGPVTLDLRINGKPSLEAVSGQVRISDAEVSEPRAGLRLENLNATADFDNGRIMIDAASDVGAGGRIRVNGPFDLRAGTIDIGINLDDVVARDPNLYEVLISGDLRMSGVNADGPLISGVVNVERAEIRIPSSGVGSAKELLDVIHVGDTRPVRATRARAGVEAYGSQAAQEADLGGPAATPPANPPKLDLQINAPNQIFIRGRGVDAEMGGNLRIQGTTRKVMPIGQLELIRGRVDLLGKRFDLTEGIVDMQGSLVPFIRLVAETSQDGITTRIIIDGEAKDPDIIFESSPEMPEEEVISQLLFGRGLDNISALQAAQLANAIAVLAGRGGIGIVGNLREKAGLDDLDLQTDDDGNVQLRAGKYLSDNVYTDVSVGDDGTSNVNLNLDISDTLRARGSVGSDGDSTIGIYYEKDY